MKRDLTDFNEGKLNRMELKHVLGGVGIDPPPPIQGPSHPIAPSGTGSP